MSEELAETAAEGPQQGGRRPRRRTGRGVRPRRPKEEAPPEQNSMESGAQDGASVTSAAPAVVEPVLEGGSAEASVPISQPGEGQAVSEPGDRRAPSPRRASRRPSRARGPRVAADAKQAQGGVRELESEPRVAESQSGTPASQAAMPESEPRVAESDPAKPETEGPQEASSQEHLAEGATPLESAQSPGSPGPGVDDRRRGRRPPRPRGKPAGHLETQAGGDGTESAVTSIPAVPAPPGTETEIQPFAPAPRLAQGDQGRPRTPRRRRRGSPRRDRTAYPQGQAAPLKMLIAAGKDRNQIAVLQERELIEHYVSHDEDRSIVGNIYLGRVQNVLPGMEAAFLDIGEARNAVLYAGEVSFDEEIEGPPPRIESMLKSGQAVLAQVTKDPMGSKGARLTTEVSLAGRYVVLVPGADSMGISRRLSDEERKRLREIAGRIRPPRHGLIVRTAADGVSESDLEGDIKRLVRIWSEIEEKRKNAKPPKLLYSEPDLAIRGIRDLFTADVVQVIVDDEKVYEQIRDYLTEVAPVLAERVELYQEETPLFQKFQVVEQLRKAIDRKIWLKSGGHIVIDRTEAMTVIDVNTGRFVGKSNLETTVLHANLEAAEEIAKQLRLRDIGGIIVIDFIDMMHERNRQELVRTFESALQRDKTRTQVFNISELGLLQMTRKNVSEGLLEAFSDVCGQCEGRGIILNDLDQQAKTKAEAEEEAEAETEAETEAEGSA